MKKEYKNESGQFHREDGPAVEGSFGKYWYINGLRHRLDGPAVVFNNNYKEWYINGKLHREDGPAVEYSDGYKFWYLNGIEYSEEEYNQEVIKIKLKRLLELY